MHMERQIIFAHYRLDLASEQLWCGSQEIPLPAKAFALLRYLVEHAGQLVSKAELFTALWPGTVVTDDALTFCVGEVRKALRDNAKAPQYIETVPRRGFRFIAKVVSRQSSVVSRKEEARDWRLETGPLSSQVSSLKPLASPLVGRDAELAQLHSLLDKALSGERQMVFVTGEPGIGKTTLLEGFVSSVRCHQKVVSSQHSVASREENERGKSKGKGQKSKQETDPQPLIPQAKSLELRATMSLVRLRRGQARQEAPRTTQHERRNKLAEAHRMLSEVYQWFTEGFDTKDLQEAKALLEALSQ
jgi:DNA-binding winged helix-turn-helix (wHTH) protein